MAMGVWKPGVFGIPVRIIAHVSRGRRIPGKVTPHRLASAKYLTHRWILWAFPAADEMFLPLFPRNLGTEKRTTGWKKQMKYVPK
ncbi:hypothetical protein D3C85_1460800 [compost metagenome]